MNGLWVITLAVTLSASLASATPRIWTSADGRHQTEAELVEFRDGQAHLRRVDGGLVVVPLNFLSAEDREYVRLLDVPQDDEPEPPPAEEREWKSVDGRFSQRAVFLGFSPEGNARLQTPEGRELTIDPARLCAEDQRWLRRRAARDAGGTEPNCRWRTSAPNSSRCGRSAWRRPQHEDPGGDRLRPSTTSS